MIAVSAEAELYHLYTSLIFTLLILVINTYYLLDQLVCY